MILFAYQVEMMISFSHHIDQEDYLDLTKTNRKKSILEKKRNFDYKPFRIDRQFHHHCMLDNQVFSF